MSRPKTAKPTDKMNQFPMRIRAGNASVSVYRVKHVRMPNGFQFVVAWNSPSGRQRRTFNDEARAVAEARATAQQLNSGHVDAAQMTSAERDEWIAAREIANTAGKVPLLSAMQEWARARELARGNLFAAVEFWAERNGSKTRSITVADAVERYLRARRADGVNVDVGALRTLKPTRVQNSFYDTFAPRLLASVTTNELANWLETHPHPVTRNTHRKWIVALWRWCRKRGFLPLDVTTAAERTDRAHEPRESPVEIMTAQQLRDVFALVASEHAHYLPALALAAFCGMRSAEVHGQKWADIDFERGFVRVTNAKPRTPANRRVPLCETAKAWLEPSRRGGGEVCANLALERVRGIARVAGLGLPRNGLRHTWISARVEISGDVARTALEAGTSTAKIHRHYRELMKPEEAKNWFSVLPSELGCALPL